LKRGGDGARSFAFGLRAGAGSGAQQAQRGSPPGAAAAAAAGRPEAAGARAAAQRAAVAALFALPPPPPLRARTGRLPPCAPGDPLDCVRRRGHRTVCH